MNRSSREAGSRQASSRLVLYDDGRHLMLKDEAY
jgi:hypothetical protein